MAETMRDHRNGPEGACTFTHLTAAGFTAAEIEAYRDEARALLSQRSRVILADIPGRMEGAALVKASRSIRRRRAETQPAGGAR